MGVETPSLAFSIIFGLIYLIQMGRFGGRSVRLRNTYAHSALNFWTLLAYAPVVLVALNPIALPRLSGLILWARENILFLLAGVVILAEILIRLSKQRHIEAMKALVNSHADTASRYEAASILEQYEHFDEAIAGHRRIIRDSPDFYKSYVNLAALLGMRSQFAEAEQLCRQAITINSEYAPVHFYLGMALTESGQHTAAMEEFRSALRYGLAGPLRMRAEHMLASPSGGK